MTGDNDKATADFLGDGSGWETPVPAGFTSSVVNGARRRRRAVTIGTLTAATAAVVLVVGVAVNTAAGGRADHAGAAAPAVTLTATLPQRAALVAATALAVHSGFSLRPVPGVLTAGGTAALPGTVSAAAAIAAATNEVRGDALTGTAPIKVSLAYATDDITASGHKAALPLADKLVWVVEADNVQLVHGGGPLPGSADETEAATVQWLIDAKTGQYVEARDFPSGSS